MSLEQAAPERMRELAGTQDLDWDAVYADQAPRVYNYFRFRLGHEADVEDLTARTFERAWRSRAHYRRDLAGFSTWLFKIAQNVRLDYMLVSNPIGGVAPTPEAISNGTYPGSRTLYAYLNQWRAPVGAPFLIASLAETSTLVENFIAAPLDEAQMKALHTYPLTLPDLKL